MLNRALPLVAALALVPSVVTAQSPAYEYIYACDSGDLVYCAVAGLVYETGAGGLRDVSRAESLYERACRREVQPACSRLEILEGAETLEAPPDELVRVGYVADAYDGTPIGGAVVRVRGVAGIGERRYVSDATGRVVLDPLPRGRHPIEVLRGGYQTAGGELPVPWDTDFLVLMEEAVAVEEDDAESTVGQIYGQVTDPGGDAGISDVEVTVSGGGRVATDGQGRFRLSGLEPGRVVIEFRRLGYEPRITTVDVEPGRTVEIYAAISEEPIELEPIQVTVASRYLARSGFYRRSTTVPGEHFTFRDIENMAATTMGDILRRAAGVTVVSSQIGVGSFAVSNRRRSGDATGRCPLQPYFNGVPTVNFELEILSPDEVEAVEVYHGANVPPEYLDRFQLSGASCGVVLFWTRDPRRPR